MNYGQYTSTQYVEIVNSEDESHEIAFEIALECTSQFYPETRIDPACGPEFEVESIALAALLVNSIPGAVSSVGVATLTLNQFVGLVGEDISNRMIDDARQEASETGEF